jgi:hypothetical protein
MSHFHAAARKLHANLFICCSPLIHKDAYAENACISERFHRLFEGNSSRLRHLDIKKEKRKMIWGREGKLKDSGGWAERIQKNGVSVCRGNELIAHMVIELCSPLGTWTKPVQTISTADYLA